jgi:hypothetical protein
MTSTSSSCLLTTTASLRTSFTLRLLDWGFHRSESPDLRICCPLLTSLRSLPTPRPHFSSFVANKSGCANRPLDRPCVALAWPLGHAWVAQGWPNPKPNPKAAGRGSQAFKHCGATFGGRLYPNSRNDKFSKTTIVPPLKASVYYRVFASESIAKKNMSHLILLSRSETSRSGI